MASGRGSSARPRAEPKAAQPTISDRSASTMAAHATIARRPRGHGAARSPIPAVSNVAVVVASPLRVAAILALLLALPASAALAQSPSQSQQQAASALEGRWRSQQPALTLDIARCAEGFCGMAVDDSGGCGGRVLTFSGPAPTLLGSEASGRLQLPGTRAPLDARVALAPLPQGTAPVLEIVAVEAGGGGFMRRVFPFEARFARVGAAGCAVRPVS
jgi:hypothetical protein